MGYYIDELPNGKVLPAKGKAQFLIENANAQETDNSFKESLVCVVTNAHFEAAGFCYSEKEFAVFDRWDGRPKQWLIVPNAAKLSKYNL